MRVYRNFQEATSEVKRELREMGIIVHPHSWQNKKVMGDPNFDTLELQNYIYCVTDPQISDLTPTQPWADVEFHDRVHGGGQANPGNAWTHRKEIWEPLLEGGKFAYTYDGRMCCQLEPLLEELKGNPDSRQLFLSIWDPSIDIFRLGGLSRIPCTIGYLFQARRGKLDITYLMRSCDFVTHFQNDIYLACKLQRWMANKVEMPVGMFTHYLGSLHVFNKDLRGVF